MDGTLIRNPFFLYTAISTEEWICGVRDYIASKQRISTKLTNVAMPKTLHFGDSLLPWNIPKKVVENH